MAPTRVAEEMRLIMRQDAQTILDGEGESASKIMAVNVYGDGTQTSSFEVIEGIVKAINAGANPST